jgi:hypothetical protein
MTSRRIFNALLALTAAAPCVRAAQVAWQPVSAEELAGRTSTLAPDAPAEVIFGTIDVDDRNYPYKRRTSQYIRFKIYDPEKAASVTRISALTLSVDGGTLNDVEIHARLTLPDGTSREFGKESIQTRSVEKAGVEQSWLQRLLPSQGLAVDEKFLAVSGIEAGAIIDYQVTNTAYPPPLFFAYNLQRLNIPVRKVTYRHRLSGSSELIPRVVMLNGGNTQASFKFDPDKHLVTVTGQNLPGLVDEPFAAPIFDRSLTVFGSYSQRNLVVIPRDPTIEHDVSLNREDGPWAGYATLNSVIGFYATRPDPEVRKLAAQLTATADSDAGKARSIHNYVHALYLRFLRDGKANLAAPTMFAYAPLGDVISFDKHSDVHIGPLDFIWLALALDRAAGLDAQAILLPNRTRVSFSPDAVVDMFLPDVCLRVKIGDEWMFSLPETPTPMPFGRLPWFNQGQLGLIVQDGKQEFIEIPNSSADQSVIANTGAFQLDPDGGLSGTAKRVLTGEPAFLLRERMRMANDGRRHNILERFLKADFESADVTLTGFSGADDLDAPLELDYELHWADFAETTKSRLIFRPSVFHGLSPSPFASDQRVGAVQFPYSWKETDDLSLQLPAGYKLESPSAPQSMPGDVLGYRIGLSYRPAKGVINLRREFISNLSGVPLKLYPRLKGWYDNVAQNDGHELVAVQSAR